jgi:hypothetical protein
MKASRRKVEPVFGKSDAPAIKQNMMLIHQIGIMFWRYFHHAWK